MKIGNKDTFYVSVQLFLFLTFLLDIGSLKFQAPRSIMSTGLLLTFSGFIVVVIAIYQLRYNISPFPTPVTNGQLIEKGMYKYIRHPIYTGILMITLGWYFYMHSFYKLFIVVNLYVLFYFKSKYEEEKLIDKFPNYEEYKQRTGRFTNSFSLFK